MYDYMKLTNIEEAINVAKITGSSCLHAFLRIEREDIVRDITDEIYILKEKDVDLYSVDCIKAVVSGKNGDNGLEVTYTCGCYKGQQELLRLLSDGNFSAIIQL